MRYYSLNVLVMDLFCGHRISLFNRQVGTGRQINSELFTFVRAEYGTNINVTLCLNARQLSPVSWTKCLTVRNAIERFF